MFRRAVVLSLVAGILASCSTAADTDDAGRSCDPGPAVDCTRVDLSGQDLSGRDLSGTVFRRANLSGANLSGANLSGANFEYADLTDANLSGANLSGAVLFTVSAAGADFSGANLSEVTLENADMRRTRLEDADLSGADLRYLNASGTDARSAVFDDALLVRSGLDESRLDGASFKGAVVSAIDIFGATLDGSDWTGALVSRGINRNVDMNDGFESRIEPLGALICSIEGCSPGMDAAMAKASPGRVRIDSGRVLQTQLALTLIFALVYREAPNVYSRFSAYSSLAAVSAYPDRLGLHFDTAPVDPAPESVRDVVALYAAIGAALELRLAVPTNAPAWVNPQRDGRDLLLWESTKHNPSLRPLILFHGMRITGAIAADAATDGSTVALTYEGEEGQWEPTPPGFASPIAPQWGGVRLMVSERGECDLPAPQVDWRTAALEVKEIVESTTEDQRDAARFWDDERTRTSTPVGHWRATLWAALSQASRKENKVITAEEMIRDFAAFDALMSDTVILVWREKFEHKTPRPITVLLEEFPDWNTYIGNPPFPAYPSGHAAISAAAAEYITGLVGPNKYTDPGWSTSVAGRYVLNISPRTFPDYRTAAEEAAMSRVWGGIHYPIDASAGATLGRCAASVAFTN